MDATKKPSTTTHATMDFVPRTVAMATTNFLDYSAQGQQTTNVPTDGRAHGGDVGKATEAANLAINRGTMAGLEKLAYGSKDALLAPQTMV